MPICAIYALALNARGNQPSPYKRTQDGEAEVIIRIGGGGIVVKVYLLY
jgi:hypothetical protein